MDTNLSLGEILAGLEDRMARLREQEAHHAEREAFHRERRAASAAELSQIMEHAEALRKSVAAVAGLGLLSPPAPPDGRAQTARELPPGKKPTINLAVQEVISRFPPDRPFGLREVLQEINRHYTQQLGGPVEGRQVSVSLRWMARTRRIHRVQAGTSHRGSQYVRERPRKPEAG